MSDATQRIPVTDAMLAAGGFHDGIKFDPSQRRLPVEVVKRRLWEDRYRAMAAADTTRVQVPPDQMAVRQALREAQEALAASQHALALAMELTTHGEPQP